MWRMSFVEGFPGLRQESRSQRKAVWVTRRVDEEAGRVEVAGRACPHLVWGNMRSLRAA